MASFGDSQCPAGKMSSNTRASGAQFAAPGFAQTNGVAFNTSINEGNASNWAVSERQPLLSGERLAQSRQLELAAELADVQWQAARQALMLRTVERYFDVELIVFDACAPRLAAFVRFV